MCCRRSCIKREIFVTFSCIHLQVIIILLMRKRGRLISVQKTSSIHEPVTLIATSKRSRAGCLRLCVISLSIAATILQIMLILSSQQQHLTFRQEFWDISSFMSPFPWKTVRSRNRYDNVFRVPGNHVEVQVRETDELIYSRWRREFLKSIDDEDMEDRYDPDEDVEVSCRRTKWARVVHSTCQMFHEISMDHELYNGQLEFLGSGTYRDAWLLRQENVVYKTTILANPRRRFDGKTFTLTLTDANIMEALTASNRITDIYGYCGSSVMTESLGDTVLSGLLGGEDSKDPDDANFDKTVCQNSLTLEEKLDMAIQFTEAIAELQGYVGGVMMHGDFHSPQWFRSGKDIKLNDFNKGHIFAWDGTKYCPVERCYEGSYRAPEDIRCEENCNEASDTYSLGNNFYMLLTGMWPHYEYSGKRKDLYKRISEGEKRPYIDPAFHNRSIVEDTLIRLMKACWEQKVSKRISVFHVLKELYRVRDQLEQETKARD